MPFAPGELVNLRFTSLHVETARLEFMGALYTVANTGLTPRLKDAYTATLIVPKQPGKYPYKFSDGEKIETGNLRVTSGAQRRAPLREAEPAPVRYRGPGSGVR